MQAVKRYDPYRGVKLSSYAAWWIRAYMLRFILNNWRMVKIGTTQAQRKLFFNLSKEKAKLSAMGIEPTHAEIAKRLNVDEKDVIEMDRRLSRGDASLDAAGQRERRQAHHAHGAAARVLGGPGHHCRRHRDPGNRPRAARRVQKDPGAARTLPSSTSGWSPKTR